MTHFAKEKFIFLPFYCVPAVHFLGYESKPQKKIKMSFIQVDFEANQRLKAFIISSAAWSEEINKPELGKEIDTPRSLTANAPEKWWLVPTIRLPIGFRKV